MITSNCAWPASHSDGGVFSSAYIDMSISVIHKKGCGITLGIVSNLNCTILTISIVVGQCQDPRQGLIELNQQGKAILTLAVDFQKGIVPTRRVLDEWKSITNKRERGVERNENQYEWADACIPHPKKLSQRSICLWGHETHT
jgi:hypothetical protein